MKINEIPLFERPREKAIKNGINTLTNAELLAIIIGSGTKDKSAIDIANNLLKAYPNLKSLFKANYYELMHYEGISKVKALYFGVIKELMIRIENDFSYKENLKIITPYDVYNYMHLRYDYILQEELHVFFLNCQNQVISEDLIARGSDSELILSNKLICKMAIERYAKHIILCHNHPSGNSTPSSEDRTHYISLKNALSFISIKLIDHIIIAENEFYSLCEDKKYVLSL